MRIEKTNLFILLFSLILTILVVALLWDMNFFPSDADAYYLPAAARIPFIQYLSQIHDGFDYRYNNWLHGKEATIALVYLSQKALHDYQTLRPIIILFSSAFFFSAALLFFIAKTYWGKRIGLICYLLCISCLWPYIYILFPKHQPLGLFFFLFATWLLVAFHKNFSLIAHFFSGVSIGFMLYSSPVSFAYIPFYLTALTIESFSPAKKTSPLSILSRWFLLAGGFLITFLYFNAPYIAYNVRQYIVYINASANENHLYSYQHVLQQWVPGALVPLRGNILWVVKYFFLVMPVLFPVASFCLAYLFLRACQEKSPPSRMRFLGMIVLGLSPVLMAEAKGVSQYGANYFPAFLGILFLLGTSLYDLFKNIYPKLYCIQKKALLCAGGIAFFLHVGINGYLVTTDLFPSRLATTYISQTLKAMNIQTIYVHALYPLRSYILQHLNPQTLKTLTLKPITHLHQAKQGYALLLPITTKSILSAYGTYQDFDKDIYLNEIVRKGTLDQYTTRTFKTVTSSKIWSQEEEILSWMSLTKNLISAKDLKKGYIRLLSAEKIQQDRLKNIPRTEYLESIFHTIRFLGTQSSLYAYKGEYLEIKAPGELNKIERRIIKIGNPTDSLMAYVYRKIPTPAAKTFASFAPYGQTFSSPVKAEKLSSDPQGSIVSFHFDPPLALEPSSYFIGICRTGPLSDRDFYRILLDGDSSRDEDAQYLPSAIEALNLDILQAWRRVDKNTAK